MKTNKKNVLFWVGVKSQDPLLQEKHGGFKYLDISRKSWEWWCKKHDVIFFPYEVPGKSDTSAHKVTWQRWFDVFPQLEQAGINYKKIAVIDGSTLVSWQCPNFFNLVDELKVTFNKTKQTTLKDDMRGTIVAWRSLENIRWINDGIEGYKGHEDSDSMVKGRGLNLNPFDLKTYVSCGFQIFDESHREFLETLKEYYFRNYKSIMLRQNKHIKRGTDQPVYNWLLHLLTNDLGEYRVIEGNKFLSPAFFQTHLNRFDWFSHNWQLKDKNGNVDKTPFFIKYGFIWFYSGFPERGMRYDMMKNTWNTIERMYK